MNKECCLKECVITKKFNCPNEIISGIDCSACKIPDQYLAGEMKGNCMTCINIDRWHALNSVIRILCAHYGWVDEKFSNKCEEWSYE